MLHDQSRNQTESQPESPQQVQAAILGTSPEIRKGHQCVLNGPRLVPQIQAPPASQGRPASLTKAMPTQTQTPAIGATIPTRMDETGGGKKDKIRLLLPHLLRSKKVRQGPLHCPRFQGSQQKDPHRQVFHEKSQRMHQRH